MSHQIIQSLETSINNMSRMSKTISAMHKELELELRKYEIKHIKLQDKMKNVPWYKWAFYWIASTSNGHLAMAEHLLVEEALDLSAERERIRAKQALLHDFKDKWLDTSDAVESYIDRFKSNFGDS
jgi:hypothetical protein